MLDYNVVESWPLRIVDNQRKVLLQTKSYSKRQNSTSNMDITLTSVRYTRQTTNGFQGYSLHTYIKHVSITSQYKNCFKIKFAWSIGGWRGLEDISSSCIPQHWCFDRHASKFFFWCRNGRSHASGVGQEYGNISRWVVLKMSLVQVKSKGYLASSRFLTKLAGGFVLGTSDWQFQCNSINLWESIIVELLL